MKCRICESNQIKFYKVISEYRLLKCNKCKVIFLDDIDKILSTKNLYEEHYFENYLYESIINFETIKSTARYYIDYINYFFGEVKSVLDVGAGFGLFVKAFRELGLKAEGVEISQYSIKVAKEKFDVNLFNGELKDFQTSHKFDLICFYHSFEHISEPHQTLDILSNLLNTNGILWLSLPNVMSLDRFLEKDNWNGWSLPFHLFHYSPRSIKYLLNLKGYSRIKIQKAIKNPLKSYSKVSSENNSISHVKKFSKSKEIIRAIVTFVLSGQNMNVFAKKKIACQN